MSAELVPIVSEAVDPWLAGAAIGVITSVITHLVTRNITTLEHIPIPLTNTELMTVRYGIPLLAAIGSGWIFSTFT